MTERNFMGLGLKRTEAYSCRANRKPTIIQVPSSARGWKIAERYTAFWASGFCESLMKTIGAAFGCRNMRFVRFDWTRQLRRRMAIRHRIACLRHIHLRASNEGKGK